MLSTIGTSTSHGRRLIAVYPSLIESIRVAFWGFIMVKALLLQSEYYTILWPPPASDRNICAGKRRGVIGNRRLQLVSLSACQLVSLSACQLVSLSRHAPCDLRCYNAAPFFKCEG